MRLKIKWCLQKRNERKEMYGTKEMREKKCMVYEKIKLKLYTRKNAEMKYSREKQSYKMRHGS